jgi:hypothetical protein
MYTLRVLRNENYFIIVVQMITGFYNVVILFLLVCVDGGEAGDGTTKGTCLNDNEVCTALGECLGI